MGGVNPLLGVGNAIAGAGGLQAVRLKPRSVTMSSAMGSGGAGMGEALKSAMAIRRKNSASERTDTDSNESDGESIVPAVGVNTIENISVEVDGNEIKHWVIEKMGEAPPGDFTDNIKDGQYLCR